MTHPILTTPRVAAATFAACLCLLGGTAHAQSESTPAYRVLIDSVAVGSATTVTNLPGETTRLPQHIDSTLPRTQRAANQQASIMLTTTDSGLLTVLRAWMGSNNSGSKDTVQPKTVEIDRITPTGGPFRYVLHDAWPSKIDSGASSNVVTFVYGSADVLH